MIYELGFNKNYYTFTSILLINIVLSSKFPCTKLIDYECFEMSTELGADGLDAEEVDQPRGHSRTRAKKEHLQRC